MPTNREKQCSFCGSQAGPLIPATAGFICSVCIDICRQAVAADAKDAAAPPSPSPSPEQVVYNVAQRDPGFRKHLIEQLTAMGDEQDHGPLKTLTPPSAEVREVAQRIADDLFHNGSGTEATRLVLVVDHPDKKVPYLDMGGWSQRAVVDRIAAELARAPQPTPPVLNLDTALLNSKLDDAAFDAQEMRVIQILISQCITERAPVGEKAGERLIVSSCAAHGVLITRGAGHRCEDYDGNLDVEYVRAVGARDWFSEIVTPEVHCCNAAFAAGYAKCREDAAGDADAEFARWNKVYELADNDAEKLPAASRANEAIELSQKIRSRVTTPPPTAPGCGK